MVYTLKVTDGVAYAQVIGSVSLEEREALRDELLRMCRDGEVKSGLVDHRLSQVQMTRKQLYEFGRSLQSPNLPAGTRVAVLARDNDAGLDMTIAVAQSHNVSIRVFLDESEALAWLQEEDS